MRSSNRAERTTSPHPVIPHAARPSGGVDEGQRENSPLRGLEGGVHPERLRDQADEAGPAPPVLARVVGKPDRGHAAQGDDGLLDHAAATLGIDFRSPASAAENPIRRFHSLPSATTRKQSIRSDLKNSRTCTS